MVVDCLSINTSFSTIRLPMPFFNAAKLLVISILFLLMAINKLFSQCAPEMGPHPANSAFNSGVDGAGHFLAAGAKDLNWVAAADSINASYSPAVVMDPFPTSYYVSPYHSSAWVSYVQSGMHTKDRFFFYKTHFNLPCKTPCGKKYNGKNAFRLDLDLFADNSIYEVYVNGVAQSGNLGNIMPKPSPYQADGASQNAGITVSLANNWQAGDNEVIIQVASSAPVTGILIQGTVNNLPPLSDTAVAAICEGTSYTFGDSTFTKQGSYLYTFHPAAGCDSNVTLLLTVHKTAYTIDTSICGGQQYFGHTASGTYTDVFTGQGGCDSIRTVHLTVLQNPTPNLGTQLLLCQGDSVNITPGNFNKYIWQDGTTQSSFTVTKPGLYAVAVTNACGTQTAMVTISQTACSINFPTAFNPNNDGYNDVFKILTSYRFQMYSLVLYNRFGQKVFEASQTAQAWDGTYNAQPQPQGAYVWFCRYKRGSVEANIKGVVVLVR